MWDNIIKICDDTLNRLEQENWSTVVFELTKNLRNTHETHDLNKSEEDEMIPYGRYLIHNDAKKRFHIEMHAFSHDYTGEIHCHETWGVFWLISGALLIENFLYSEHKNEITLTHSGLLKRGSVSSFHPPESDWHRVRTFQGQKEQTVSLHIYGSNYDLNCGKYLNENFKIIEGRRGDFKDNILLNSQFTSQLQN